ncbi:hypothetical protein [Thalassospira sp. TSL5-1]|uniref:hypothetical protein n=1 Tax=Thalassospira sp. TSL5-1 TaxID=1544451 RepID=UPI000AE66BCF|nr:hypothetical protein [Thalassospira sp. TSL5-1]
MTHFSLLKALVPEFEKQISRKDESLANGEQAGATHRDYISDAFVNCVCSFTLKRCTRIKVASNFCIYYKHQCQTHDDERSPFGKIQLLLVSDGDAIRQNIKRNCRIKYRPRTKISTDYSRTIGAVQGSPERNDENSCLNRDACLHNHTAIDWHPINFSKHLAPALQPERAIKNLYVTIARLISVFKTIKAQSLASFNNSHPFNPMPQPAMVA